MLIDYCIVLFCHGDKPDNFTTVSIYGTNMSHTEHDEFFILVNVHLREKYHDGSLCSIRTIIQSVLYASLANLYNENLVQINYLTPTCTVKLVIQYNVVHQTLSIFINYNYSDPYFETPLAY